MRPFPADHATLEAELSRLPSEVAKAWAVLACAEAVGVWERRAVGLTLGYRDSVVGLKHEVELSLPRRVLTFLSSRQGDGVTLRREYLEPVTALQDDDWSLPEVALYAFYTCYNALEGRYATAIVQARHATFLDLEGDRARFDALWSGWWFRCVELDAPLCLKAGLPVRIPCERFLELAATTYRELEILVGPGSVVVRALPPPSYDVEAVESKLWSDGTHSAELRRIWDQPIAFQSRDRSFEASMSVPEHRATICLAGMDDLDDYTLVADRDGLDLVRAALERAASSLGAHMVGRRLEWTCLRQRGFEALPVQLPDTSEAALVELARRATGLLAPGFAPLSSRQVLRSREHAELAIDEYSLTTEVVHGDGAQGFRVTVVEHRSTDGAGPSPSEVDSRLETFGLPAGLKFELSVRSKPVPFRNAGLSVIAQLVGDEARLRELEAVLHGVFRDGQVAE